MTDFKDYVDDYFNTTYAGDRSQPGFQEAKEALLSRLESLYQQELSTGLSPEDAAYHALIQIGMDHLMEDETWAYSLNRKALKFQQYYPRMIRIGLWAIFLLPLFFLTLMFSMNSKLVFLTLWIVSIIAVSTFLIVIDFIHDRLQTQLSHTKRKPWDPPSSPVSASNVTLSEKFVEEDNHENHL